MNLAGFSISELFALFADILDELNERKISRSQNNPVADYAEWLVSRALGLILRPNSRKGLDALDDEGVRYQIKGRRVHPSHPSRQLSVIRNLEEESFDFLIAVLFRRDFSVLEAYKIPHSVVGQYSHYSSHQKGHILTLTGPILSASGVERADDQLREYLAILSS